MYGITYRLKYFHIYLYCYGRVAFDKCNISRRVKSKKIVARPDQLRTYKQNGAGYNWQVNKPWFFKFC